MRSFIRYLRNVKHADDIFEYIITTSEQMSSDYLPDVADFLFNYARCLHDQDEDEKAKAQYLKCINIWSEMSEDGNRKLALAHQEIADGVDGCNEPMFRIGYNTPLYTYTDERSAKAEP